MTDQSRDRWVEKFIGESFAEQKKARRWGVLFKSLTFAYLFVALAVFMPSNFKSGPAATEPHTAIVRVSGAIAADQPASANAIVSGLRRAFEAEHSKAVILIINSPGGSPVQSGYVYDEMWRLRSENPDKKLYAVITDLGASGGYYMASAAEDIYANRASLVGSIGVTASGFGFVGVMERLGVERRHYTAGDHKAFLDPFSPVKEGEEVFWREVLANVHAQFMSVVHKGRGERLKFTPDFTEDELFSGLIWSGEQALSLGLIDGLGSPGYVAREVVGVEEVIDYSVKPSAIDTLIRQLGVSVGRGVALSAGFDAQTVRLQ